MPLTTTQRNQIMTEVRDALLGYPNNVSVVIYGVALNVLGGCSYFLSKPLTFQRQLLLMVAERQVFTEEGQTWMYQERCRDTGGNPNVWGTQGYTGEELLDILRSTTITQSPDAFRTVVAGIFRTSYAKNWAHWININGSGTVDPNQSLTEMGLWGYVKGYPPNGDGRWDATHSDYQWDSLKEFVVGTTNTFGLLPQLWVDAIDALEPVASQGQLIHRKTPPPVYIFSLDTLPTFDKNTYVMIDLYEAQDNTLPSLLASKVATHGETTVFNALYSNCEKTRRERRRVVQSPTSETFRWDNTSYMWVRESEASGGEEIIYETKNYLTWSNAKTILNNL